MATTGHCIITPIQKQKKGGIPTPQWIFPLMVSSDHLLLMPQQVQPLQQQVLLLVLQPQPVQRVQQPSFLQSLQR